MWIEHEEKFYNLNGFYHIKKYDRNAISLENEGDCVYLSFVTQSERDAFFTQIRFKLFPERFGGIPC